MEVCYDDIHSLFSKACTRLIYKCINGIDMVGINKERIPKVDDMDEKLDRFGWGAVSVKGFIPPIIFMEFLSRKILPIAVDIRTSKNITYTPAPDIIHEAAGHAPIITDNDYADYLCAYGQIAQKAIESISYKICLNHNSYT